MRSKDRGESMVLKAVIVLLLLSPIAITIAHSLLTHTRPAPVEWPGRRVAPGDIDPGVSRTVPFEQQPATR